LVYHEQQTGVYTFAVADVGVTSNLQTFTDLLPA